MADVEKTTLQADGPPASVKQANGEIDELAAVNASGHVQELERNFSLLSASATGLTVGNVWPAVGGAILTAIYNGGAPGVIYEFIVVSVFYWIVAASIAELASAIPSSGAVYHWASVTPGKKYGRIVGFFAGYWNWLAWLFGCASMSFIAGNMEVQMYAMTHPEFVPERWHVYVAFLITTWLACATVCFANRALPTINNIGMFFIIAGFLIIVVVCAVMPSQPGHIGHASTDFVFKDWSADLGYSSNGFVFCMGMLNGAYAVGTPDCTTHLAEEIPRPSSNLPKAIAAQMAIGFITGLLYLITILYGINDLDAVASASYPLSEIYRQATGSTAGAIGLMVLSYLPVLVCVVGGYITCGRALWTLARDGATPFGPFLASISPTHNNPFNATVVSGLLMTALGAIYVGNAVAFNALIGSFVILVTSSYTAAILPHLLTGRKNVIPGSFWMKGPTGFVVNAIACAYMVVFIVIFCFPYALPVDAQSMNYACLIYGGCTVFVALWWVFGARASYRGPQAIGGGEGLVEKIKGKVDGEVLRSASVGGGVV